MTTNNRPSKGPWPTWLYGQQTTDNKQPTTACRNNPFKPLLIAGTLLLLTAVVFDPMLRSLLMPDGASAVGGYSASDLLGQLDGGGDPVYTTNAPDNGSTTNAQGFNGLTDMVVDTTNHRLFVSDSSNNRVLIFNLDTSDVPIDRTADFVLGQVNFTNNAAGTTQGTLFAPYGLAYDATGNRLFVSDWGNNRVMVFDVATITNGEDAANVLGQLDFITGTPATTQGTLSSPWGLAYDTAGSRLFVADVSNHRVMVFDVATITNGEDADRVLGQLDFITGTPATTQGTLYNPTGLAYDASGSRLFVGDQTNNRVMVFDVATITNGEDADRVLGQLDFITGTPATTQGTLSNPTGLAYDASGSRLFVGDQTNNRVMVFDVASITNGENATDVYGQTVFTIATAGTTQSALSAPLGVWWDGMRVYVADSSNSRLMIFDSTATPTPTATPVGGRRHEDIGFFPDRIVINDEESSTDSKNVLVDIHAHHSDTFAGTVDVLLSNTSNFSTTIPFRYTIGYPHPDIWPKTVSWDLCFGIPQSQCDPGQKSVYARFYINTAPPQPAWTPLMTNN